MGRTKQTPRYNVVSLRVSDDEWQLIQSFKTHSRRSISNIMRDALTIFMQDSVCYQNKQ